jgi:hypothetical protein
LVRIDNDGLYGPPTLTNPWLNRNAKHDFNVGYDFNHESEYTKAYAERVVQYWIEEYHIDGYRFDLSKGLTQRNTLGNTSLFAQLDNSRVQILQNIADHVWEADPEAYVILEHFADNDEEKILSEYGMMLWGNLHGTFGNAAKGSSTSLDWLYHKTRGWSSPHVVGYFESHDEERLMWGLNNGLDDRDEAYRLRRAQLAATFLLAVPGPKMIWQFGEFGYDLELNDDRLGIKPTRWEYLEKENHRKLFMVYQSLANLRTKTDFVDEQYFEWNTGGLFKWIHIDHPDVQISIVGNFSRNTETLDPQLLKAGTWYDYLTGESMEISDPNAPITLGSGEFLILTSEKIENYISQSAIILASETTDLGKDINIYPNPVSNTLQLNTHLEINQYAVFGLNGMLIEKGDQLAKDSNGAYRFDVGHLESGMYLLRVQSEQGIQIKKFYKQ